MQKAERQVNASPLTQNATYNAAGQLNSYQLPSLVAYGEEYHTNASPRLYAENPMTLQFTYNAMGQLTGQYNSPNYYIGPDVQYQYPSTGNDGRIVSRVDSYPYPYPSAPATISYAYDSQGRLSSASSTSSLSSLAWGQSFVYDPFGNLLQQNVTSGSAPALNITVDPATNRMNGYGFTYDGAGNVTHSPEGTAYAYDSENRLSQWTPTSGSVQNYYYGANGERLYDGKNWTFYGPEGIQVSNMTATQNFHNTNRYGFKIDVDIYGNIGNAELLRFAGRLVWQMGATAVTDRLSSVVASGNVQSPRQFGYYPYGVSLSVPQQPGNIAPQCMWYNPPCLLTGGTLDVAFGTYRRGSNGLDYAMNRYYDPARGRFTTPDPAQDPEAIANPSGWNRYTYVRSDPINYRDASGRYPCWVGVGEGAELTDCEDFAFPLPGRRPFPKNPVRRECDRRNPGNALKLDWIADHGYDSEKIAKELGVTLADILGLSALESGWGGGDFVKGELNNFFSQHAPAPLQNGTTPNVDGTVTMATFASYAYSAESFAQQYGAIVKNTPDPAAFAAALQNADKYGINKDGSKVPGFVSAVAGTIRGLAERLDCEN